MIHLNKKSGFSLIELMVVVALLSLAAALLVPRFIKHQQEVETEEASQPSK